MAQLNCKADVFDSISGSLAVLLILAYLISVTIFTFFLPAFGWDVLDTWAPQTNSILNEVANTADELQPLRHPPLNIYILKFAAQVAKETHAPPFLVTAIMFWLASCICCLLAKTPRPVWAASVLCSILLSVPLFENHIAIGGYAEIWISILLLAACISVARFVTNNSFIDLGLVVFFSVPIIFVKNIGGLIFLSVWVAMIALIYVRYRFFVMRICFAVVCSLAMISMLSGVEIPSSVVRHIWDDSINNWVMEAAYLKWEPGIRRLILYDRVYYIGAQGASEVFKTWMYIVVKNQSFSTLALSTLVIFNLRCKKTNSLFIENYRLVASVALSVFICSLFAVQAFTNLGAHATSGSDTIFSRLLLMTFPAICFYGVLVFTSASSKRRCL